MFAGFDHHDIEVAGGTIHAVVGGSGPPLLALHGFPETHLMWHAAAPALAERFTVVAPDLPGYGDSQRPAPAEDHEPHSKRAMGARLLEAMLALGHERFAIAGHDRGGRVGYRLALDHPERVSALAVLDIVPTVEVWERANDRFSLGYWHWGFLALPAPRPEEMLLRAPLETFLAHHIEMARANHPGYPLELIEDYADRLAEPSALQGMCEDYRAGAGIDRALDEADRAAGRRIECPLLVLWGSRGALPSFYGEDILAIWRPWAASECDGRALDATHYMPEDQPAETAGALVAFFAG